MTEEGKKKKRPYNKSCPFCGDRGRKRTIEIEDTKIIDGNIKNTGKIFQRRVIECRNLKCFIRPSTWLHVQTEDWDEVIKKWNRRNYDLKPRRR